MYTPTFLKITIKLTFGLRDFSSGNENLIFPNSDNVIVIGLEIAILKCLNFKNFK